ncbi:MAG: hypothetical protein M3P89_02865 [Actinomycetota bacterium]|nr:hypothetical protein [Actinomycetota bacterium]
MGALARLSGELQETVAHLNDYQTDQSREQRLTQVKGSSRTPAYVVGIAGGALAEVRVAAAHMSSLLTAAELAMLAVATSDPD